MNCCEQWGFFCLGKQPLGAGCLCVLCKAVSHNQCSCWHWEWHTVLEQKIPVGLARSMSEAGGPRLLLLEESPQLSKANPHHSAFQTISVGAGYLFWAGTTLVRCWLQDCWCLMHERTHSDTGFTENYSWMGAKQYIPVLTRVAAPVSLSLSILYPPLAFIQGNFHSASHLGLKCCPQKIFSSPGIFGRGEWANILEHGESPQVQVQV